MIGCRFRDFSARRKWHRCSSRYRRCVLDVCTASAVFSGAVVVVDAGSGEEGDGDDLGVLGGDGDAGDAC